MLICLVILLTMVPGAGEAGPTPAVRVVDHHTGKAIPEAFVTLDGEVLAADGQGLFPLPRGGGLVKARAHGYQRAELPLAEAAGEGPVEIRLGAVTPRGLYLSFYGVGSKVLRGPALKLIEETELNALVIDVKGDRGMIPYRSSIPLAAEIGAQRIITVRDVEGLITHFKEKGIYLIARIVVFKDDLLAAARPELAVRTPAGGIWRDRENLAWVDPFRREVWEYNIRIAEEAARLGFDEIQFDYVRFPDRRGVVFSQPNTEANRVAAIGGFLAAARERLIPYNVFLSADLFGYVAWNQNDTDIGQTLAAVAPSVDYLSLMLYPSGFQFGIPGYRNPVQAPYETVHLTLKRASQRTGLPATRFRPWLQAFKDYAFDRRHFSDAEIRAQIRASEKFGSTGWMLWNPRNAYSDAGLLPE
jgi:hypothetical protein